jgi:hypothetical protein
VKGWVELKAAFSAVVDGEPGERERRRAELRAIDPALPDMLEALLEADARGEALLPLEDPLSSESPRPARIGNYDVIDVLGAGAMGEVYRARDPRLGRDVAIKVLRDATTGEADRLARFEREARVLASLNHPRVAHVSAGSTGPTAAYSASAQGVLAYQAALSTRSQPVLVDRAGKEIAKLGTPGDISDITVSPDGSALTVSAIDPARSTRDLWLYPIPGGPGRRLTFDAGRATAVRRRSRGRRQVRGRLVPRQSRRVVRRGRAGYQPKRSLRGAAGGGATGPRAARLHVRGNARPHRSDWRLDGLHVERDGAAGDLCRQVSHARRQAHCLGRRRRMAALVARWA